MVSFPILFYRQMITQVLLIHYMEKANNAGAVDVSWYYLVPDMVIGFISGLATLMVLWPLLPWIPAAFPDYQALLKTPPT